MKRISAGIIGGTHGMGQWLARLFEREGFEVFATGRKTRMQATDVAAVCDVIVVTVPIAATASVIEHVGPLLREDQLLMDLTSLKTQPVEQMLAHSRAEVVGCHPLFGPHISGPEGQNIVLCPGRGERWYGWLRDLFLKSGYTVLERTCREHDRMMAIVQALNHLNTVALGLAVAKAGIPLDEVSRFSTPVFKAKMDMVYKVFTDSPDLYADIIVGNPDIHEMLRIVEETTRKMVSAVKDTEGSASLRDLMAQASAKLF